MPDITTPDSLFERWPELSHDEKLVECEGLPRDKTDDFFLELSSREQCELIRTMPKANGAKVAFTSSR